MDDNNSLIERLAYKLVEKHIAGKTMASALERAKQLNAKGLEVSISFLSEVPNNRAKVNYIANTYMQLCRQMARQGIKGSIHVPMEQLGLGMDEEAAISGMNRIHATCKHYKIFGWYDFGKVQPSSSMALHKEAGVAFNGFDQAVEYMKKNKAASNIKVMLENKEEVKKVEKALKTEGDGFEFVRAKAKNLVITSPPKELVKRAGKDAKKGGGSLVLEFNLGESEKMMSKLAKKHGRASVYMPFGKDWISYAMNRIPEGRMRSWASGLISKGETEK